MFKNRVRTRFHTSVSEASVLELGIPAKLNAGSEGKPNGIPV
jgi:hypothetical protein